MKKFIIALALLAALALPLAAQSRYDPVTVFTQAQLVPQTATNINAVIDVGRNEVVGFQLTACNSNTIGANGVCIVSAWLSESVDGTSYTPVKYPVGGTLTTNAVGGTSVFVTNLTVSGRRYYKVAYVTNSLLLDHVTNVVLKVGYPGSR